LYYEGLVVETLRRKASRVPRAAEQPIYALWGRGGVRLEVLQAGAIGFDVETTLAE